MAEPIRKRESRDITVEQLWEEYLAHCRAKNLSPRTIEWYGFKLGKFADWCGERGIFNASELDTVDLEDFLAAEKARGIRANSLRGTAQILKTLCRFGFRRRFMADIITGQFEMPKAPQVLIETFTDEQLHALLEAPDVRTWNGGVRVVSGSGPPLHQCNYAPVIPAPLQPLLDTARLPGHCQYPHCYRDVAHARAPLRLLDQGSRPTVRFRAPTGTSST